MSRTSCLKRILIFALELIVLIIFVPVCKLSAAEAPNVINLDVSQGSIIIRKTEITVGGSQYPCDYHERDPITITGTTTTNTVKVESGTSANITLENVNIDVSTNNNKAAFEIEKDSAGSVDITLVGDNTLKSGKNRAGLQKNVTNNSKLVGKLTIQGTGSLTAIGGTSAAGIGGGYSSCTSNITICGGTITADGGRKGIGSTSKNLASNIVITGGSVKAIKNYSYRIETNSIDDPTNSEGMAVDLIELTVGNASSVKIDDNPNPYQPTRHGDEDKIYVYLTKVKNEDKPEENHKVKLDGEVKEFYYYEKKFREVNPLDVSPPTLKNSNDADADYYYDKANHVLTIKSDKNITIANKNPKVSTIDRIVVPVGVSANITLTGVNIDRTGLDGAAFEIAPNNTGNVTITLAEGSENILISDEPCAGLQKNGAFISEDKGKLIIQGTGSLTAKGGSRGAGIGGGKYESGSNINIVDGTITATGGSFAAGIGGGEGGDGSNINISGGTVIANGKSSGAGIGGGSAYSGEGGKGSNIKISGGTVTATGDGSAADIGRGSNNDGIGSNAIITGGSIKAANIDTPTDAKGEEVFPFEIHTGGKSVTIETADGKSYQAPSTHEGDTIYVYLPKGSKDEPNSVNVDGEIIECYHVEDDSQNNDWSTTHIIIPPVITPDGGKFTGSKEVEITAVGSTIYYTTDDTDPTTSSTLYTGAFDITETTTIRAIAYKNGVYSEVVTAVFEKQPQPIQPFQPIQPPVHEPGSISKDVQLGTNALKTDISTSIDELADIILTDKDQLKVDDGIDIKIILTVNDVTQTISDEDKSKIEAEISKLSYKTPGAYLDVSLMKVVGEVQEEITETGDPITITFDIPEAIRSKNRVYAVLRIHDGEKAILPDLDENENTVTVQTNKFSTYAIIYKDLEQGEGSDTSGDPSISGDGSTSGGSSDGNTSGDASGNSPDGSTSGSGSPDGFKDNPYTGGVSAMAVSILAALGALAAVLACASKGKK